MNCRYITLLFNIFADIVQAFIKCWIQLLYPWGIESAACPWFWRNAYGAIAVTRLDDLWLWLMFQFSSVVKNPSFISTQIGIQKLISFLCVAGEKRRRGTHSFRFVIVH
jgi:hypothetical protein